MTSSLEKESGKMSLPEKDTKKEAPPCGVRSLTARVMQFQLYKFNT